MKKLLLLSAVLAIAVGLNAQSPFGKGSVMFNAGVGAPANNGFIPTANFSGEVGVIPTGTVGIVSFGGLTEFHLADDGKTFPRFYVGGRAAWHLLALNTDIFDVYGGVGVGVIINGDGQFHSGVDVHPDMFVGGRYFMNPKFGLFAEAGYTGLSFLKFGITFGL